ncbi:aminoglycoside phosphotransferase family protein, partial [bacterium]|nr:aminoglycoside phosphotransferase family protein [bacterium]
PTSGRIFFEDTRAAKIARIRAVGCTHFVDDLEEVFLEADFPEHVERHLIIMDADDERKAGPYRMHADWSSIAEAVLGPEERLRSLAERLAGATPTSIELCRRGGNNRVYRVETTRGLSALKVYPSIAEDPRDRLGREHRSLAFLAPRLPKGLVPAPLAIDREARAALYEWVEGVPVNAIDASARHGQDVDAVVRLLAALHEIGSEGQDLPEATEPCLAASELLARLDARLGPLKAASGNEPELGSFLESVFEPLAALARSDLLEVYARLGWSLAARIERSRQTLSPSDFGFHNALRRGSGALAFVDFEYFGWDDPVKASSDFLWHAGMKLSPAERTAFLEGACGAFGDDETFADRLAAQFPLHGLHWCLLVLNEFLPERWKRRVLAGASESWEMAKRAQLEKARSILTRVRAVRESRASLRNLVAAGATQ